MRVRTRTLKQAFVGLVGICFAASAVAQPVPSVFTNYSQIVPSTATDIWPAQTGRVRLRAVAIDTAIQSGSATTVTIWCAWGTVESGSAQNVATVGGTLSFPLNVGFDDIGQGVNQSAMNCIQSGGTHAARFEVYTSQN